MTDVANCPDWDYRLDVVSAAFGKFTCNYRCSYCHRDYFLQSVPPNAARLELAEGIRICNGILKGTYSIHLAGSGEPLAVPTEKLAEIVLPLRELENCHGISLTTNGYYLYQRIDDLVGLGIRDINVSIPCLDLERYPGLMKIGRDRAKDIIERTKRGIIRARERGISVDVNVCVSYDIGGSIGDFLELSRGYDVHVKFFPVIPVPSISLSGDNAHFRDLVRQLSAVQAPRIESSGRYLTLAWDLEGAQLRVKPGDIFNRPLECYQCSLFLRCEESCWRSVRISPWYVQPCGIRTDNVYWYQENDADSLYRKLVKGGKLTSGKCGNDDCQDVVKNALQQIRLCNLIVLEGPDGSGKSVISRELARQLGYIHYRTPPNIFGEQRTKRALEKCGLEMSRYLYYLSSMHYANQELLSILGCAGVVCDRWIQSTHIYHQVLLGSRTQLPVGLYKDILEPDLTIVLDVDEGIQSTRLGNRMPRFDNRWENSRSLRAAINERYNSLDGSKVVHIASNGTIEETLAMCLKEVHRHVAI